MKEEKKGKWIWYPDDFEIELSARFMERRYERDVFIPVFWKQYSCWRNVKFSKTVELAESETIKLITEGKFNVLLDGAYVYDFHGELLIPAGKHELVISVYNAYGLPTMKLDGKTVCSDDTWQVSYNDHNSRPAAYDDVLINGENTPNCVKLPTEALKPVCVYQKEGKTVYDFGKEIFAFVRLTGVKANSDKVYVYYGESEAEALNDKECELLSELSYTGQAELTTDNTKAFRYLTTDAEAVESVTALAEYLPLARRSYFQSSNETLNRIYETAKYTLHLNTREFIIDGIKRDRWLWSADAYQGYLMHYYSFFDKDAIRRTMIALFGKEPFDLHLNHIMDYSFFWVIGFCEYYEYTGDRAFVEKNISKAVSILDYCISRTNGNGLMEGLPGDWVFVDWADGLDNTGELAYEQILYCVSLQRLTALLKKFGRHAEASRYEILYADVKEKLGKFWDEEQGAFVYSYKNGESDKKILRYANIFAILYDLCDERQSKLIAENVLKSDKVQAITTPYMKFFEQAALMKIGECEFVMKTIEEYWGGMLREGATTFWETYDATQKGPEKYAMYGRKFGKSLCHAWGASPLYILGRYVVGLRPNKDGSEFIIEPNLVNLEHFTAKIPFAKGEIEIKAERDHVEIYSTDMNGILIFKGKTYQVEACKKLRV